MILFLRTVRIGLNTAYSWRLEMKMGGELWYADICAHCSNVSCRDPFWVQKVARNGSSCCCSSRQVSVAFASFTWSTLNTVLKSARSDFSFCYCFTLQVYDLVISPVHTLSVVRDWILGICLSNMDVDCFTQAMISSQAANAYRDVGCNS